jgi:flavin reductase (DIM6/NTAB) family NADH-FMN oxidoreductase RutF
VLSSGAFAVHLLRDDQLDLVAHFGLQSGHEVDKFATIAHLQGSTGAPLLRDCLGLFECRVVTRMDAGDHTLFLGDVVFSEALSDGTPLWTRDLRARWPQALLDRWDERNARNIARSLALMDRIAP